MSGEDLKNGLEGLRKIEDFADVLFDAMYWVAVIFIVLLVAYFCAAINCYFNKKKRGSLQADNDNFLGD
ncbi:MAG: hypothetical protein E7258_07355 [Lachnospiraceae bacterium]|nr:hypothetical protein [Lachnospiraceae bacterium]